MIFKFLILLLLTYQFGCEKYKGEQFPVKYLSPEDVVPEYSDVEYYLVGISKVMGAIARSANETDINRALGTFFMKSIIKRTIKDHKNKIEEKDYVMMKNVLLQAEYVLSHFYYTVIGSLTWSDILKRAAFLLKEEDLQVEAIAEIKGNLLKKWILSNVSVHDYEKEMDEIKFPKERYLKETEESIDSDIYTIHIEDSDYCLGEIINNPVPRDPTTLTPCVAEEYCAKIVYKRAPSISYGLSHRMLNIMMARHLRRCYMRDPDDDKMLMEALCSGMYREAVYLARRGYFYRDIWMEHIALCGMLGYQEFFRRHWFRKVVSWIDGQGCIAENFNYEANRTRYHLEKEPEEKHAQITAKSKKVFSDPCAWHQMALSVDVMAHGVRHAVQFSVPNKVKDEL